MNLLISAGPTREFFDSVRFISNPSSGKMGYAIAAAAVRRRHNVLLVSGPVNLEPPKGVNIVRVTTAAEMSAACKKAYPFADAAVMTAAVCDYRPAKQAKRKQPKSPRPKRVLLEPTEDIAAALGRLKDHQLLIGFAMEDSDPRRKAERKCKRKNCDLMVLNGPENVGRDEAAVELFTPGGGWQEPISGTKVAIAAELVRAIEEMRTNPPLPARPTAKPKSRKVARTRSKK
jgi:phosphopantothenoylcysteine decarboxylase / phosphopantothenate---cysteine ligase